MYKRNCPKCETELTYSTKGNLNIAINKNSLCSSCSMLGKKTKKDHPETVDKKCEWCDINFEVTWKCRKQKYCSKDCMYAWRKEISRETVKCLKCKKKFVKYKNSPKIFCSNYCSVTSEYKKEKLREWHCNNPNPMDSQESRYKIKQTKLERYGDSAYNNMKKQSKTMQKKYGVKYGVLLAKSNGIRISKGQRLLYEHTKKIHSDALLEVWLDDVQKSVDIFIPSINTIVEYYGNYWHCNPEIYDADYYNKQVKLTAKEIWERDQHREEILKKAGYNVIIKWEE